MVEASNAKPVFELLLDAALQDLAACKLLAGGAGIGDAVVGFHAQQSVEKSIKAVLSANMIEFRRTHAGVKERDLPGQFMKAGPRLKWSSLTSVRCAVG